MIKLSELKGLERELQSIVIKYGFGIIDVKYTPHKNVYGDEYWASFILNNELYDEDKYNIYRKVSKLLKQKFKQHRELIDVIVSDYYIKLSVGVNDAVQESSHNNINERYNLAFDILDELKGNGGINFPEIWDDLFDNNTRLKYRVVNRHKRTLDALQIVKLSDISKSRSYPQFKLGNSLDDVFLLYIDSNENGVDGYEGEVFICQKPMLRNKNSRRKNTLAWAARLDGYEPDISLFENKNYICLKPLKDYLK